MLGRAASLDTTAAEGLLAPRRQLLKVEHEISRRIKELHQHLEQSKDDPHLTPENVLTVVSTALALADQPPLMPVTVAGPEGSALRES